MNSKFIIIPIILPFFMDTVLSAELVEPIPGHQRFLEVPIVTSEQYLTTPPPKIDGILNDEIWKHAITSSGFWCSSQNKLPTNQTEVLTFMDKDFLYFGFRMYDDEPDKIQSSVAVRDVGLGYNDTITVELDTFLNRRSISKFSLNPSGTQSDEIAGGRSSKIEWKGDWLGSAKKTDFGWTAEFAIPFAILNYDENDTNFGVNFTRYQSRTREYSNWANITPQELNEEMGQLTGLMLPSFNNNKTWTFMPFLLLGKNIPDKTGEIKDSLITAGIDMRFQPSPDLTGMIAANPDFSQVEQAVTDISFSYSEKAVDDNRPFFIEGADYFSSKNDDNQYFYSNRVPDFDVGAKSFGRLSKTQFGIFAAKSYDNRNDFSGRVLYEINDTNSVVATLVGTTQSDFDNILGVAQFNGRLPTGFNYSLDIAHTNTTHVLDPDIPQGSGSHYAGALGWKWDYIYINFKGDKYDTEYFPADALLDDDLPGTKGVSSTIGYYKEVTHNLWHVIQAYIGSKYRETYSGIKQQEKVYGSGGVELNNGIGIDLYAEVGPYRPVSDIRGIFEDYTNADRLYSSVIYFNTRSSVISGGLQYDWGNLGGYPYDYRAAYGWWRPVNPLYLKLSVERTKSYDTADQLVFTGSWDINTENALACRFIYTNNDNDNDAQYYRLAYAHKPRKGISIFAVYDDDTFGDAEYSIKFVKTF